MSDSNILTEHNTTLSNDASQEIDTYDIANVDQDSKSGNYLLTFGNVGSGKSTLQQWLITWLTTKSKLKVELKAVDGNHFATHFLRKMVDSTKKGLFPASTPVEDAKEFRIAMDSGNKKFPPIEFSFFEISGEELKNVVPDESNQFTSELPDFLHDFLANPKIRFSLLVVSDVERHCQIKRQRKLERYSDFTEDEMICSLLDYLQTHFGKKYARMPVLMCLSKWDKAAGLYEHTDSYLNEVLPQTYNRLRLMQQHKIFVHVVAHSVGIVKVTENGKPYVSKEKYQSTEKIAKWVYASFTNQKFREGVSFWDKFTKWFA